MFAYPASILAGWSLLKQRFRARSAASKSKLPRTWRVHREVIYLCVLAAGVAWFASQDSLEQTQTTTTTPTRFLWARYPAAQTTFDASKLQQLDHLILVAGHAVLDPHAESLERADRRDGVWYLMDYQRNQDLPQAFVSHIKRGVDEAAADPQALLVFSGGQTRPEAGPLDEASSYYRVAEHYGWWDQGSETNDDGLSVPLRTVTEDFATDSFQNLMFSICRFHEVVGSYPSKITVIGFSFKMQRFASLHRAAIRFPIERFRYIGIEPPSSSHFDLAKAEQGEKTNSVRFFEGDPYGCKDPVLREKRSARNPFKRTNPYPLSCPAMRGLLEWCKTDVYPDALPWPSVPISITS